MIRYDIIGIFSYHEMILLQFGQTDRLGSKSDIPSGSLYIRTFKKLPIRSAKMTTNMCSNPTKSSFSLVKIGDDIIEFIWTEFWPVCFCKK